VPCRGSGSVSGYDGDNSSSVGSGLCVELRLEVVASSSEARQIYHESQTMRRSAYTLRKPHLSGPLRRQITVDQGGRPTKLDKKTRSSLEYKADQLTNPTPTPQTLKSQSSKQVLSQAIARNSNKVINMTTIHLNLVLRPKVVTKAMGPNDIQPEDGNGRRPSRPAARRERVDDDDGPQPWDPGS
jgi:hypothetical protein